MKVLVTGASGFIGSYIVDNCIEQGDTVRVLVRETSDLEYLKRYDNIEYVYGSLTDRGALDRATQDIVIAYHSAARSSDWGSRKQFYEANFLGTKYLVEACRGNGVKRLVYVSSPSVVFHFSDEINIDESYPYPPKFANLYSEYKAMAEKLVLDANVKGKFETVALRPHAVWGPRDRVGFFPTLLHKARNARLRDLSQGKDYFTDLCYVQNAANACTLAAKSEKAAGNVYFVTDGKPVNIWKLFNSLCGRFGVPQLKDKINPKIAWIIATIIDIIWKIPYLAGNYRPPLSRYTIGLLTHTTTYSIENARRHLSYKPEIDLETGLNNLEKWIEEIGGIDEFLKYVR
jgi:2-alkyl-3-oxoalkanoate reductase